MNTQEFIALEEQYGAHNYHPLDVVVSRAEGVWVEDVDGQKYLDCLAAYSAVNQGHCHPAILKTFIEQAGLVTLTSRAFRNDRLPLLYKKLHDMTGYEMSLPMNSGAEAVETAIKTARRWAYDVKGLPENSAEIVVASGNFHGRTTTIVGFSDDPASFKGFGPYCTQAFPMHRYGDLEDLKSKITPNTCAVMIEPIQGEGGVVIPPDGYLKGVEQICREHDILFICDEIQSGLGRSGKLFAHYYENVRPDIVIIGKALSGGFYPVSAILADRDILGVIHPGEHGSTFGGNPLGAAVAVRALEVIEEEHLIERSAELGAYFADRLRAIDSRHITEVRARGLWIGMVLGTKARPFTEALKEEGILCKETHENIIRFAPPLVITKDVIDWALERIEKVLTTK
ncbi:MAG: ornithine--oxo-acid transaminase [Bacteroidetes bacterium]|nr:ornithine--oxo-acid transaminase [Bacteroidota bacterium]